MSIARSLLRFRNRNKKLPPRLNKVHFEVLEPRLLLSGSLETTGVAAALSTGIGEFENKIASFINSEDLLDTRIPLVVFNEGTTITDYHSVAPTLCELLSVDVDINRDGSIGGSPDGTINAAETGLNAFDTNLNHKVDIIEILQGPFKGEIQTYLAGSHTNAAFVTFLDGLDDAAGLATGLESPADFYNPARHLQFQINNVHDTSDANQVSFSFDVSLFFRNELALDLGAVAEDLGITFPSGNLVVGTTLDFTLTLGAFTSGEAASASDFFIEPSLVTIQAMANANNLNADVKIGFLGANVDNGTISLTAQIAGAIQDPATSTPLGFGPFETSATGTLTATPPSSGGNTAFYLRIGDSDTKDVRVGAIAASSSLAAIVSQTDSALATAELGTLVNAGSSGSQITLSLPAGLDVTPLGFAGNELFSEAGSLTASNAPTLNTAVKFLVSVNHGLPKLVDVAAAADLATLITNLNAALTGTGVTASTVGDPGSERIVLTTASPLQITRTLTLESKISYVDLQGAAAAQLLPSLSTAGSSINVNLPIDVKAGLGSFAPSATISFTLPGSSNPFDVSFPDVVTDADGNIRFPFNVDITGISGGYTKEQLLKFVNIKNSDIVAMLRQFGGWLERFRTSDLISSYDIPFANADLSRILNFQDMLSDGLLIDDQDTSDSSDDVGKLATTNGIPSFLTAQELVSKLATALGVPLPAIAANYNPTTEELTYHINLSHVLASLEVPIDFSLDLAPLASLSSNTKVQLDATAKLDMTLGLDLSDTAADLLTGTTTLASLGVDVKTSQALTADQSARTIVGRLANDATFTVSIGGGNYRVKIAASGTSTNNTIADLITDVNAALGAADDLSTPAVSYSYALPITASAVGNRIKLSAVSDFTLTATAGDPAINELGFKATHEADGVPGAFSLTTLKDAPRIVGRLTADTAFTINLGSGNTTLTVLKADTDNNSTILDLVNDVNKVLTTAGLNDEVLASSFGSRLVLTRQDGAPATFTVTAAGGNGLGFGTSQTSNTDDLIIFLSNGDVHRVSLDGALDIATVISRINTSQKVGGSGAGDVTAAINDAGTGLKLVDHTFAVINSYMFMVEPINGSNAATQLGIVRMDVTSDVNGDGVIDNHDADGIIEGAALKGPKLTDRFFAENATVSADFTLTTPGGIDATANFGFVGISLTGTGNLAGTISAGLKDGGDNRLTLTELLDGAQDFRSIVNMPTVSPKVGLDYGKLDLALSLEPSFTDIAGLVTNPNIDIIVNTIGNPFATTVIGTLGYAFLDSDTFILTGDQTALLKMGAAITFTVGSEAKATKIKDLAYNAGTNKTTINVMDKVLVALPTNLTASTPVLPDIDIVTPGLSNLSGLGDLLNFDQISFDNVLSALQNLLGFVDSFEQFEFMDDKLPLINKSIHDLVSFADRFESAIQAAENNPAGTIQFLEGKLKEALGVNTDIISLSLDEAGGAEILRLNVDLSTGFSKSLNFQIPDFMNLGALGVVDLNGAAGLAASGSLAIDLDFGVDLANPGDIYLYKTTGAHATLNASASDINFRAAVGPVGIFIKNGSASIGGNFNVDLKDSIFTNDRALLSTIFSGGALSGGFIETSLTAHANATLPTYFPREGDSVGNITLAVPDLTAVNWSNPGNIFTSPYLNYTDVLNAITSFDFSKFNIFDNIPLAVDGLDMFLEGLQYTLDSQIFGLLKLPVIGDALSEGASFIEDFREDFIAPFMNLVENADDLARDFSVAQKNIVSKALYDVINPLGILQAAQAGGDSYKGLYNSKIALLTNLDDYLYNPDTTLDLSDVFVQWSLALGGTMNIGSDINFDLGIPGLGLETKGAVSVQLAWDLDFGFGLNFTDGVYIDMSKVDDLTASVIVTLADGSVITGKLGFLQLDATWKDDGSGDQGLGAVFGLDISDGAGGDGKIGFAEIGNIDISAKLAAEASVMLGLKLGVSEDVAGSSASYFPSVVADFVFEWAIPDSNVDFGNPETSTLVSITDLGNVFSGGLQLVEFQGIGLDLGSFVSDVLGPIVGKVKDITEPVQPLIDVFTTPLPVVSELGLEITLLDIAGAFGDVDPSMIYAIADIVSFINSIPDPSSAGALIIPFGNFTVYTIEGGSFEPNLTDAKLDLNSTFDGILAQGSSLISQFDSIIGNTGWFGDALNAAGGVASDIMKQATSQGEGDKKPWAFPIFEDPKQVFGLLMGKDAVLVTYDMPPLSFDFEWSQFFSFFGPLGISINVEFGVTIDFAFGYDTLGIREFIGSDFQNPLLLVDGFYVSDTDLPTGEFGTDVPELTLRGGLWAAAELNLGVARAGVGGGIFAEVNFDLFDPNHDGRVRLAEILGNIENEWNYGSPALAPLAIFDVYGKITAELFAFLKIDLFFFEIDERWNICPPITIVEFDIPFTRPPNLATELGDGDLQINAGPSAGERLNNNLADGDEHFVIEKVDGDTVRVKAPGLWDNWQEYDVGAGKAIIFNGGEGNDQLDAWGVADMNVIFEIDGGAGNDKIYLTDPGNTGNYAAGAATISGGDGDDEIYGGSGNDVIHGDKGVDEIHGGVGDDLAFGDAGTVRKDSVVVTVGLTDSDDELYGDAGNDILIGGGGSDTMKGGGDNDLIIGDGATIIFTAADKIKANIGVVKYTQRDQNGVKDFLWGEAGLDTIYGGYGDDEIHGGAEADTIFGEAGQDEIYGDAGNDFIYGDAGAPIDVNTNGTFDLYDQFSRLDLTYEVKLGSGGEADTIYGGAGDDTIFGAGGNEEVHGDAGNDTIFGGSGVDTLYGDAGNDTIYGQGESDVIYGGTGDDTLDGGASDDVVYGENGPADLMATGAPADPWNTEVYGANTPAGYKFGLTYSPTPVDALSRNDTLIGGIGSDFLDGQSGNDIYKIRLQGADTSGFINIYDSGDSASQTDFMHVKGTMYDDAFLLRKSTSSSGLAFVALLNTVPYAERINYWSVEGGVGLERMLISGLFGDDHFASDDVGTDTTIEGNEGEDTFQVGQLYHSPRDICASDYNNIAPEDVFATIETTVGWLSDGINRPMTIYGGVDNDYFTVFHNKAVLSLFGEDGDDTFLIKAFALAGSQEPFRDRTDVSGGAGVDLVQYAMNAPVNIDGGDGFDRVIIIGTEFGDDFVVTKDGVYGAGLNVNYVNIESLSVDGAEGDDRFYVRSTGEDLITELFGGLGSDTFNMSGDTPPVISNDLRGHSGVITHEIENTGTNYDETIIAGISANVADNDTADPVIVISEPDGSTVVTEGGTYDVYYIVLSKAPTSLDGLTVQVMAPVQTQDQQERKARMFQLYSPTEVPGSATADRTTISLKFTPGTWDIPQEVWVSAGDFSGVQIPDLNFDDNAIEGDQTGFINHVVTTSVGIKGSPDDGGVTAIQDPYDSTKYTTEFTDSDKNFLPMALGFDLEGYILQITDGPGAGQSLRIKEVKDADTLILDGKFRECVGSQVGSKSQYKISRDIEANRAITVLVHDNDKADVIVTPSDDSTDLFEDGATDTVDIVLARQPEVSNVAVTLASNDGQLNFSSSTLTFTNADWGTPQTVTVSAVDDGIREGFHHGLISFTSAGGDSDRLSNAPYQETIILTEEQAYVGLMNRPALDPADPTGQTYLVSEVLVNGEVRAANTYKVQGNKIVFLSPNADYDDIIGTVKVTYQYAIVGYDGFNVTPLLTDIADNEVPQVKITQTGGSTDVIEENSILLSGVPWDDTYEVVLTQEPTGNVQILVEPQETKTSSGKIIHWGKQVTAYSSALGAVNHGDGTVTLTFTSSNWYIPQVIFVSAVDDTVYDGDDTQVFAPEPHTISDIQGPLYLYGKGGNGSIIAFEPTMLHYETNFMIETDVVESVGADGTTMTVPKDTLIEGAQKLSDVINDLIVASASDAEVLAAIVSEMLTVTIADGQFTDADTGETTFLKEIGQFRLIIDAVDNGDDTVTLTLNEGWDLSKSWELSTTDTYDLITEYRITHMSANFFAIEAEQIDYLFVYNEDSQADNEVTSRAGWLTDSTTIDYPGNSIVQDFVINQDGKWLRGFGMAAEDLYLGGVYHPRGITYGDMEVVEINLGDGIDNFTVKDTHVRSDGFQTWTIINTGDEPVVGAGDVVTVDLDSDAAELHTGTVTSATQTTLEDSSAAFPLTLNERGLAGYRVEITGGTGIGQQRIIVSNTATVLTFDKAWDVLPDTTSNYRVIGAELYTGTATSAASSDSVIIADTNQTFPTANGGLAGHVIEIIDGAGVGTRREIILNTATVLTVSSSWNSALDTTTVYRIYGDQDGPVSVNAQGGDDTIDGSASSIPLVIFGGAGEDTLTGGSAGDIIFGDRGRVEYTNEDGKIVTLLGLAREKIDPQYLDAFTSNTLTDNDGSYPVKTIDNQGLEGLMLSIPDGRGFGQRVQIIANITDTLTVTPDWDMEESLYAVAFDGSSAPNTADDTITVGLHGFLTGDRVIYDNGGGDSVGGLTNRATYFAIKVDNTTIKLAETEADANNGDAIDLTALGTGESHRIIAPLKTVPAGYDPATDFDSANPQNNPSKYRISFVPEDQTDGVTRDPSLIIAIDPNVGAHDTIIGSAGSDRIFGGAAGDTIYGNSGEEIIFGDHGRLDYTPAEVGGEEGPVRGDFVPATLNRVRTTYDSFGGADSISGGQDDDIILGGTAGDTIHGNEDDDLAFGDFGEITFEGGVPIIAETINRAAGGVDTIYGDADEDVLAGGAFGDNIDGGSQDDLIFGDNVRLDRNAGSGDAIDPRFRALTGTVIYGPDGSAQVAGEFETAIQPVPGGRPVWADWTITLDQTLIAANFGNDYIAGGADNDEIFGQRGDDTIQSDGSIDLVSSGNYTDIGTHVGAKRDSSNALLLNPSSGDATDGDDYIEGNSGNDVIFGNLGQDDIIGGSSTLFSLTDVALRDDGSDLIFGGTGEDVGDVGRNDLGDESPTGTGHARDADMILADNGNIFRLVGTSGVNSGAYLAFNYDSYTGEGGLKIIARAAQLLDYTPGGPDFTPAVEASPADVAINPTTLVRDIGAADEVHGGQGDDFIYGMVGNDVLFGDGQNDVMIGGYGADWISGGTGDDGILGDDGRIFVSRNSSSYGEPLYDIAAIPAANINQLISTSDGVNNAILNVNDALKYTADLTPENLDQNRPIPPDPLFRPLYANDIIYGGWGNDSIHGGAGDDAVSGAEAPELAYTNNYDQDGTKLNSAPIESDFFHPFNPGNVLGYQTGGPNATKFDLYDANDPLRKILLDPLNGSLWKGVATDGREWILNFDQTEGPTDTFWIYGTSYSGVPTDGDDHIFGDLGNDWVVGGTGRDVMFSGWGDDLLNMDDNLNSLGAISKKGDTWNPETDTNPSYEDLAFGGAGRDVLLINTNGDRAMDWIGEFNSFYTPFAQFGAVSVNRLLRPGEPKYLYALSESAGADQTLAAQYSSNPSRNGEPFGELGLVLREDAAWGDQSGAPRDPQPGNTGGGKVDLKNSPGTAGTIPIYATAEGPLPATVSTDLFTDAELASIVVEAKALWTEALGAEDSRLALLDSIQVEVGNLPEDKLGATIGYTILIDSNAAGYGWFIDPTPADDSEFANGSGPSGVDLLTVVMHEMGHVLGFNDLYPEANLLMSETLDTGERHFIGDAGHETEKGSETLVVMDSTDGQFGSDESMSLVANTSRHSWLNSWLLNGTGNDDDFDPNSDIKIVIKN